MHEVKAPMIFAKMADIMQEIEAIGKTQTNTQQKYKFRGIDDVYNAVNPLFKKHRVFMSTEVLDSKREERKTVKPDGTTSILTFTVLQIRLKFFAEDGSSLDTVTQGEAMDSGDKGSNKAMAAAQKYAIIQAFAIPTIENSLDIEKDEQADLKDLPKMLEEVQRFTESKRLSDWGNEQKEWLANKEFVAAVKKRLGELQKMNQ